MLTSILFGPGLRVNAGLSGAGKTHTIRVAVFEHVRKGVPVIVIDRTREWDAVPPDIAAKTVGCRSVESAIKALDSGARLAIVRAPLSLTQSETEAACTWACSSPELRGIALPEAHRALPKHGELADPIQDVIGEWRHFNVALWCDSQRLAKLNTDVVELAREVRLFAMSGKQDQKALREMADKELVEQIKICAERLDNGEPGWHVFLRAKRSGPYELRRETLD